MRTPILDYEKARTHTGHKIQCVAYAGGENIALECIDCYEVIADVNRETVTHCSFCGRYVRPKQREAYTGEEYQVLCRTCEKQTA